MLPSEEENKADDCQRASQNLQKNLHTCLLLSIIGHGALRRTRTSKTSQSCRSCTNPSQKGPCREHIGLLPVCIEDVSLVDSADGVGDGLNRRIAVHLCEADLHGLPPFRPGNGALVCAPLTFMRAQRALDGTVRDIGEGVQRETVTPA